MKIQVLGCSGGIGDGRHTTSFLVDDDVLLDAGTGVLTLSSEALCRIDHVFISHAHLDHILSIPLMLDSVGYRRDKPLTLYASQAVIETLNVSIFNWCVWPDFTRIPNPQHPYLRMQTLELGESVTLAGGRTVTALPAEHVVPTVGYKIAAPNGSFAFSGDTTYCEPFWRRVSDDDTIRYIVIETAFSENERAIAEVSKHLSPAMLMDSLARYTGSAEIFVTHLKPGQEDHIMRDIADLAADGGPQMLTQGHVFEL